jgi:hypothetical protein
MERHPDDSARPEQVDEEGFDEGQADLPPDPEVGDFATGQEDPARHEEPGRFDEGQADRPHEHEGDFAEGQREHERPDA